jgi:hypothetical protein
MCSKWTSTISTGNSLVVETAAVNAPPLIHLASAGLIGLLRDGEDESIVVPHAVEVEIRRGGPEDPAVLALEGTAWLRRSDEATVPALIAS